MKGTTNAISAGSSTNLPTITDATITSYSILQNEIGYNNLGRVVGKIPMRLVNAEAPTFPINVYRMCSNTVVRVGVGEGICYSLDGIIWSPAALSENVDAVFNDVTYGNGMFVAVGNTYCAMSVNGITWTVYATPTDSQTTGYGATWTSICFGNNKFIVGRTDARGAVSTDGINWTQFSFVPDTDYAFCRGIVYGQDKFVGIFDYLYFDNTALLPGILVSTDGEVWTRATIDIDSTITSFFMNGIAYGNNTFVVSSIDSIDGIGPMLWYSTNGTNWTKVNSTLSDARLCKLCYGDKFVAVGDGGYCALSNDGINWNFFETDILIPWAGGLQYIDNKYIAIDKTANLFSSIEGNDWIKDTSRKIYALKNTVDGAEVEISCYNDEYFDIITEE